jgi:hypothetical protein
MSSRWDTILARAIGIILIGLLGGGPCVFHQVMRGITKSELDARISRDPPAGSPKARVLAYIGSRKWELHAENAPVVARLCDGLPLKGRVFTMRFSFDTDEKLVAYSLTEI